MTAPLARLPACLAGCLLALGSTASSAVELGPVRLGTTLHYDIVSFDAGPDSLRDVDAWRRQELGASGKFGDRFDFKFVYAHQVGTWNDAYIRASFGKSKVSVGHFKIPYGADWLSSSSQLLFTERGAGGVFNPGRKLGVLWATSGTGWGLQAAAYGQGIEGDGPDSGLAARAWTWRGSAETGYWHGALAATRESPGNGALRFRVRPEVGSFGPSWEDSGAFAGIDRFTRSGFEAGWQQDRLAVFGEWTQVELDGAASRSGRGGMLQASWTLHGKHRAYDPGSGLFVGPKGVEGLGQVELAFRYSSINLPRRAGGTVGQSGPSVGVNLQYGPYLRFMLDRYHPERRSDGEDAELWALRLGFVY